MAALLAQIYYFQDLFRTKRDSVIRLYEAIEHFHLKLSHPQLEREKESNMLS
jgi:hypothetical protein